MCRHFHPLRKGAYSSISNTIEMAICVTLIGSW